MDAILNSVHKIGIYGYGREGQSSAAFIRRHFPEKELVIVDDFNPNLAPVDELASVELVVVTQGIQRAKVATKTQALLTSNTELFFQNLTLDQRRRVIGVSGTKGKSTTAKFAAEVLARAGKRVVAAGNYGRPLLDLLDRFQADELDYIVAELSSGQLEFLEISPGIAIFLNLYPDHLNYHGSFSAYQAAKEHLWNHQQPGDLLIVPETWRHHFPAGQSGDQGQKLLAAPALPASYFPDGSIFRADHFREDLGTVAALAESLEVTGEIVRETARVFEGLPHRLEYVTTKQQITFYDDAIATNPDATLKAVEFFGAQLGSIILGGQDRQQNFLVLAETLTHRHVAVIIYESETAPRLIQTFGNLGYRNIYPVDDFAQAVATSFNVTPAGSICLLSTAAPSYDRFTDFNEQGRIFQELINSYPQP